MTRQELRDQFRVENPEITDRVITDAQLNSFMLSANKQVCCATRCIVSNETEIIDSAVDTQFYDLELNIAKFYDIDDMPGGGVYYDDEPLIKSSAAEMNYRKKLWKESASSTPKRYWRRGKYLWFDVAPDTAGLEIGVDCILIPDDFTADAQEPFNDLGHLQVFSDAILKFMQWRSKQKVGKPDEAAIAERDYVAYVAWMRKQVKAGKYSAVYIKPT